MNDTERFIADMDAAGFPVEHYHGRYYWHGPAVRTAEDAKSDFSGPTLQNVIRATTVKVQWDNMGFDYIAYPVESEPDYYFDCARLNEENEDV